jgi:sulfur carrier protein
MKIVVNGDERDVRDHLTLADLVRDQDLDGAASRGIAAAVDSQVVPRSAWGDTMLSEGQRVELVAAMQGG